MKTSKNNWTEPKYKEDILDCLVCDDSIPLALRQMRTLVDSLIQANSRAADEIERLREENKELIRENRTLKYEISHNAKEQT